MSRRFEKPRGITGGMAEEEIFGSVENSQEFQEWLENHGYMTFKESMRVAKENQPGDPTDPDARFANDLHATLAEAISPDNYEMIRFNTAVGSNLDYQHGIDAFFEIETASGTIVVTLDVKTYDTSNIKADVLIVYPNEGLDPKEDKLEWEDLLNQVASDIISVINIKMKRLKVPA